MKEHIPEITREEIRLQEVYFEIVLPLIHSKQYVDAFKIISQYPKLKGYLCLTSESQEMYNFTEGIILGMLDGLKGLEGMTKPCNEKMKPSTLPSWGDSR